MHQKKPSVNIIILNWNGIDDTLECLDSVSKLTYPNVTTVVVDNGSGNNEAARIAETYPSVIVLPQTENLGFCGGCNVGINYALDHGADYVMLLNNDTLVPPDIIDKLFAGIEDLENVGAISPVILEYPETKKIWFSDARWVPEEAQFRLARPDDKYEEVSSRGPFTTQFACGCCMFVSVDVLKKVGLLDERYFAFYDEAAWCAEAHSKGFESYVVPTAVVYHKVSRSTPALVSTYLLTRNRMLWMKENLPFGTRIKSFPYLLREVGWHWANILGLTRRNHYSKAHSKAVLHGYRDYLRRKFFRWSGASEKAIFSDM